MKQYNGKLLIIKFKLPFVLSSFPIRIYNNVVLATTFDSNLPLIDEFNKKQKNDCLNSDPSHQGIKEALR